MDKFFPGKFEVGGGRGSGSRFLREMLSRYNVQCPHPYMIPCLLGQEYLAVVDQGFKKIQF